MKNRTLCLILIFFSFNYIYSQVKVIKAKNSIFVSLLDVSGSPLSVSYDRIIVETQSGYFSLNTGFGYFTLEDFNTPIIGIPLSLNYSHGLDYHHFEFGLGFTYSSGMRQEDDLMLSDAGLGLFNISHKGIHSKVLFLSSRIGYRYQKSQGGLLLRLGFTPLITLQNYTDCKVEERILPLLGVGIGYTF